VGFPDETGPVPPTDITTRSDATQGRASAPGAGLERLDPEGLGAHLGPLLRTASTLCDSRESAEDLVQETVARVLSRPRSLRGGDERAYLMRALRNTFLTSRRRAARRPRAVTPLGELDPADRRAGTRPEEALIARQVFPAIAQLPESFRLALVAVDIAGLSYAEAARVLNAPEATITTRLYRARQRVARELDPERSCARRSNSSRRPYARPTESAMAASTPTPGSINTRTTTRRGRVTHVATEEKT
jgi:RNA polymerase sigma-70 factor, ECF subfamily